jgi:hypothetical protein
LVLFPGNGKEVEGRVRIEAQIRPVPAQVEYELTGRAHIADLLLQNRKQRGFDQPGAGRSKQDYVRGAVAEIRILDQRALDYQAPHAVRHERQPLVPAELRRRVQLNRDLLQPRIRAPQLQDVEPAPALVAKPKQVPSRKARLGLEKIGDLSPSALQISGETMDKHHGHVIRCGGSIVESFDHG